MEALRQDDPRRFGRFTVLARFDEGASAVRYVARDIATGESALITAARPELAAVPVFSRRFQAEARTAERLAGGWVAPPLDTGDPAETPADGAEPLWTAAGYVPALPLAEAIGIAGPLPERALRILGAGIAEILSRVHAAGSVLQGLAPGTVLLAADGPRLTAFGPLGAAASAEARPGGQLSVRLGYLTPEQIEGKEVSAASDLFVLGLLLAYAATGTTPFTEGPAEEATRRIAEDEPELDAVPQELRELIASCLAKDPDQRPTAGTVAAELALEGAAGLARGGWLPEPLAAAVADQEARVLALEVPEEGAAAEPGQADTPAAPEDARPEAPRTLREPESARTAPEPEDARPLPAPPLEAPALRKPADAAASASASAGDGDIGEDRGTTRFLNTGPRPPQNDRPTTQLALPHELTAAAPAAHPVQPAAPLALPAAPVTPQPHSHTHGGPAPYPAAALPAGPAGPAGPGQGPMVSLPLPPAPAPAPDPAASRRTLLTIAAAAVGGLIVGGGSVAALGSGDTARATDEKPAPKPRRTLPGQAPEPRWIYAHPASESSPLTTALWQDKLLVVTSESQASAVDLRTGKRLWQRADGAKGQAAPAAGADLVFVASPTEFLWLSPENGKVVRRVRYTEAFDDLPGLTVGRLAGSSGPVIWFTGSHTVTVKAPKPKKGKKKGKDKEVVEAYFFAYDIVQRKELWRTPVPAGRAPGTPAYRVVAERSADVLVRQDAASLTAAEVKKAKGKGSVRSFDQKTGKLLWTRQYGAASLEAATSGDEDGTLYAAVGQDLQAFEADTTKPLWRVEGSDGSWFGTPLIAGPLIHTTERSRLVGAVERESGRLVWRRSTEVPGTGPAPSLTLSGSGKTLIAADAIQVTAFSAADGERLWKFQDIGSAAPKGETVSASYRTLAFGETVVVQRDRSFYAFPVA
ncbi:PQQ-binding-like beta-propeller repeat protein [Streptomyces globisporus]|uniref:outer membrane protein assembly factor BamB family protein n=1 Tax=Streptomyces TaxID=1883 RepID=UPI0005C8D7A5|nr:MULTISPECIES: PQQ-binding-like beta-propeller repeat protein [Streptomyces]PPA39929.1 serine/threonine protein kinase [Streptomyces griseus]RAN17296.1 serine/threonine protein kinase [Streptomyces badius]AWL86118.1 serine/threonine protein kinase [Streptomyces globisporus]RAN25173.1 serine/threonine protein kinase [Streptomyces badius]UIZ15401.1 PQQ-binding-like beta-propeller repeat protein [Streptomyces sp. R527F]